MNLDLTAEEREFREEARTWLRDHLPTEERPPEGAEMRAFDLAWQRTLFDGGWAGINWPTEYGGRGLTDIQQMIWYEEFAKANPPFTLNNSCTFVGNLHGGPTIIVNGDEDQKATYLPRILRGEDVWCQGFSEPGAGSDLAGLSTQAEIDGDHLVVNGQKTWTSYAHVADVQELLVRTDPTAPKHKGITWVICDMRTPGHRDPRDPDHEPRHRLLRGLLRRRAHPAVQRGGRHQQRLAHRHVDAELRARHRVHGRPGRAGGHGRATDRRGPAPVSAPTVDAPRSRTTSWRAAWPSPAPRSPRCGR